jgi:hypothetical protein
VRRGTINRKPLLTLLLLGPALAGCSGASDLMSKDADWFSRTGRVFIRNVSIETPPLSPEKAVTPDELVAADGGCPGMAAPGTGANALADGAAGSPTVSISPATRAVTASRSSAIRAASGPASTPSPRDA